jgi:FeS assembly SUF system regulator
MFRLNKLTDYGVVLMTSIAHNPALHNARDLARESQLPLPTVSKLLKELSHHGLLVSHRGSKGGYSLSRIPKLISVAEIIDALEGPIGFTECSVAAGTCDLEPSCLVRRNSKVISLALRGALENLTLGDLMQPMELAGLKPRSNMVSSINLVFGGVQ